MSESSRWLSLADELFKTNPDIFNEDNYSVQSLSIYLRDLGRCVYCGLDLLQQRQHAYHFVSFDHLLPKDKYPALAKETTNLVLSCRACNGPKRQWNPNYDPKIVVGDGPLTDEQREQLIQRVRDYLREVNASRNAKFDRERELILTAMKKNATMAATAGA